VPYEDGMSIEHDTKTGKVTVYFRGTRKVLPEKCMTWSDAVRSGEAYCRAQGWKG
jgi:hypothetical protein